MTAFLALFFLSIFGLIAALRPNGEMSERLRSMRPYAGAGGWNLSGPHCPLIGGWQI
jgi:hypothetical protein